MLFPNLNVMDPPSASHDGLIQFAKGWGTIHRASIPGSGEAAIGHICVCTASDDEISDRTSLGEFELDVIDEHSTFLWFVDRPSFVAAWRAARDIANRGTLVAGVEAGALIDINRIDDCKCPGLIAQVSSHHINGCGAARKEAE